MQRGWYLKKRTYVTNKPVMPAHFQMLRGRRVVLGWYFQPLDNFGQVLGVRLSLKYPSISLVPAASHSAAQWPGSLVWEEYMCWFANWTSQVELVVCSVPEVKWKVNKATGSIPFSFICSRRIMFHWDKQYTYICSRAVIPKCACSNLFTCKNKTQRHCFAVDKEVESIPDLKLSSKST